MKQVKRKAGKKHLSQKDVVLLLQQLFSENANKTFSMKDIFRVLKFNTHPQKMLAIDVLDDMTQDGFLRRIADNKFKLSDLITAKPQNRRTVKLHKEIKKLDDDTVMHAILEEYGLPYSYPKEVEDAANEIDSTITPQDYAEREDFRDVLTFTIDPFDAKDFDDALSFRKKDGIYEVGVHIADVSHYVTEGSIIDKEASKRATSIYLVDRTIPMLPERLCNFICSLRPNEEKLAYSVIFNLNQDAEILSWRLVHTVIKSDRRFTYDEVMEEISESRNQGIRESLNDQTTKQPNDQLTEALLVLNSLAKKLRNKRFENGAVKFENAELRFDVDENGKPIGVHYKVSNDATQLIEEFMLLANKTVAESIGKVKPRQRKKTLPYRIHEKPDTDKLANLSKFIKKFNYKLKTTGSKEKIAMSLNSLMDQCAGKGEQKLIETVALRAMMKAKYSIYNIGHFGLAFDYYTHFTSPIRRYPDTMVHRLLTAYQHGAKSADKEYYETLCEHSSAMEIISSQAERASVKYKEVEFLSDKIGEEFNAHIDGITEWGVFCEIDENHCQGMIPIREFDDDYYFFDENNYCLRGRRFKNKYSLGDPIKIIIRRANLEKRFVYFALVR